MEYQHGGDVYTNRVELDYSANLSPLGVPEGVREAIVRAAGDCGKYPDSRCGGLKRALSLHHGISEESILCGNGAADLIFNVAQAVRPRRALLISPSFLEYEQALKSVGCQMVWYDLKEEGYRLSIPGLLSFLRSQEKDLPEILFLCNPNNPTGFAVERKELELLLDFCEEKGIVCVVDECFNDFLDEPARFSLLEGAAFLRYQCLLILKAFTKMYCMAGVRLGYGISVNTGLLESMERCRQPWSVSSLAQAAGEAALRESAYVEAVRRLIKKERPWLKAELEKLGLEVFPSMANYLFFRNPWECGAGSGGKALIKDGEYPKGILYQKCLEKGVLIRSCWNYRGLDNSFYRICVKTREENERFMAVLTEVCRETQSQQKA